MERGLKNLSVAYYRRQKAFIREPEAKIDDADSGFDDSGFQEGSHSDAARAGKLQLLTEGAFRGESLADLNSVPSAYYRARSAVSNRSADTFYSPSRPPSSGRASYGSPCSVGG